MVWLVLTNGKRQLTVSMDAPMQRVKRIFHEWGKFVTPQGSRQGAAQLSIRVLLICFLPELLLWR